MDIRDDASEAAFGAELRRWLEKTLPQLDGPEPWDLDERLPWWRKWQRLLLAGGYAGLGWPEEYGGAGMGALAQAIFSEECDRAGAPQRLNMIGEDFAGPTIMSLGSAQQKERFLPRILSGEGIWCQLSPSRKPGRISLRSGPAPTGSREGSGSTGRSSGRAAPRMLPTRFCWHVRAVGSVTGESRSNG
ncbi:hypothetical protein BH18ACT5_BH18ACT5_15820 [soil metagenome]